jgi:hypothetical protein
LQPAAQDARRLTSPLTHSARLSPLKGGRVGRACPSPEGLRLMLNLRRNRLAGSQHPLTRFACLSPVNGGRVRMRATNASHLLGRTRPESSQAPRASFTRRLTRDPSTSSPLRITAPMIFPPGVSGPAPRSAIVLATRARVASSSSTFGRNWLR